MFSAEKPLATTQLLNDNLELSAFKQDKNQKTSTRYCLIMEYILKYND